MKADLDSARVQCLAGFGMADRADVYLFRPTSEDEVRAALMTARRTGRQVVLRGAGQSYGDAALLPEAAALDLGRMNQIRSWDPERGVIEADAGVTIEQVWRHALEDGWWPPVVSGTMRPTLAGALSANIHGKNNYCMGVLGDHVERIRIMWADGNVEDITSEDPKFRVVVSGMGLFGVILRLRLRLKRVTCGDLRVLPISVRSWGEQFAAFAKYESSADYLVSWVDAFAKGSSAGRGLIHAAWYPDDIVDPHSLLARHQDLPDTILGTIPKSRVWKYLKALNRPAFIRWINASKYLSSKKLGDDKPHLQSIVGFSFLLDYVPNWRRAYEPDGLLQFQVFTPKEHAQHVFEELLEMQHRGGMPAFLAVMKRHRPDRYLLSHGVDGYSLALDFKIKNRHQRQLVSLCHEMARFAVKYGSRFYFAKDRVLTPELTRAFLGDERLQEFRDWKAQLDPENLFSSALAKRVGLDPDGASD
ncbi:MAG: FAD-dependent oxidoreductase [Fimbriimonadaceae bacterium]